MASCRTGPPLRPTGVAMEWTEARLVTRQAPRVLHYSAAFQHEHDSLGLPEEASIREWVAVDRDEIGEQALAHRPHEVVPAQDARVARGGGDDRGHRVLELR